MTVPPPSQNSCTLARVAVRTVVRGGSSSTRNSSPETFSLPSSTRARASDSWSMKSRSMPAWYTERAKV